VLKNYSRPAKGQVCSVLVVFLLTASALLTAFQFTNAASSPGTTLQQSFMNDALASTVNVLWNPSLGQFREAPSAPYNYWVDDASKLLRALDYGVNGMDTNGVNYSSYAQSAFNFVDNHIYNGYMPRRVTVETPQVITNSSSYYEYTNQLYDIKGQPGLAYTNPSDTFQLHQNIEPTLALAYLQGSTLSYQSQSNAATSLSSITINVDTGIGNLISNGGFDGQYYDPWRATPATTTATTYLANDSSNPVIYGIPSYGKVLITSSPTGSTALAPSNNQNGQFSASWYQPMTGNAILNLDPYLIWGNTVASLVADPVVNQTSLCGYEPPNEKSICQSSISFDASIAIGFVQPNGNVFTVTTGSSVVTMTGPTSFTVTASFNGVFNGANVGPASEFVVDRNSYSYDYLYLNVGISGLPKRANQTAYPGQYDVVDLAYNTPSSNVVWSLDYNVPLLSPAAYNSPPNSLELFSGSAPTESNMVSQNFSFQVGPGAVSKITWWDYSPAGSSYTFEVIYYNGAYSVQSFSETGSAGWTLKKIAQAALTPPSGSNVVGIRFLTSATSASPVYIDDVAFLAKMSPCGPYGCVQTSLVKAPNGISLLETCFCNGVEVTLNYTLPAGESYLVETTTVKNTNTATAYNVQVGNAFDGLDTLGAGYNSMWFPGVGWVYPGSANVVTWDPPHPSQWNSNYFIIGIQRVPDWIGSYGITDIIDPTIFGGSSQVTFAGLTNTRYENSSSTPSPPGYFHWLRAVYDLPTLASGQSVSYSQKLVFMTTWDWLQPDLYTNFFGGTNIGDSQWAGVDWSNNFYYGEVAYELAGYYEVSGETKALQDAESVWNFYWHMVVQTNDTNSNLGTYVPSLAQFVRASFDLYAITKNSTYLNTGFTAANYLTHFQVLTPEPPDSSGVIGTFRMKGEMVTGLGVMAYETSYLDVTAAAIISLESAYAQSGYSNSRYLNAIELGLAAIHYGPPPTGYTPLPQGTTATPNPSLPRLWVYANSTRVDTDYSTYKAFMVFQAAMNYNSTLALIGLSRFWYRTIENSTMTEVLTGEWSSPHIETNSETQPWGTDAWYQAMQWTSTFLYGVSLMHVAFPEKDQTNLIQSLTYNTARNQIEIAVNSSGKVSVTFDSPYPPSGVLLDGSPIPYSYVDNNLTFSANIIGWNTFTVAYPVVTGVFTGGGTTTTTTTTGGGGATTTASGGTTTTTSTKSGGGTTTMTTSTNSARRSNQTIPSVVPGLTGAAEGAVFCFAFAGPIGAIICGVLGFFGFLELGILNPGIAVLMIIFILLIDVSIMPAAMRKRRKTF